MPKDRRDRSVSSDRCRASPFLCSSSRTKRPSSKLPSETEADIKEWEEARCPVCMEHPHNAVLLICTSHDKGCRPYMCDTSYRHSNCLDQFRKSFSASPSTPLTIGEPTTIMLSPNMGLEEDTLLGNETSLQQELSPPAIVNLSPDILELEQSPPASMSSPTASTIMSSPAESTITELQEERSDAPATPPSESPVDESKLLCPLCRGQIKDWIIVEDARRFMNAKPRSCACEACEFAGSYVDLRKHARVEHPLVRPSEADPERQRSWRRLERERDLGDLLSTLQSSFEEERGEDGLFPMDERGWLTIFFLIRVIRPDSSSRNSSWSGTSRARAQLSFRRRSTRLWGESFDGETISFSTEDDNESSNDEAGPWRRLRRTRRRTTPDNQP